MLLKSTNVDPQDDPHWDWQYDAEVRTAIRPAIAQEAQTTAFLSEQGISLTPDANNLFVDAVAGNLYGAFVRLENIARGNYAPDDTLESFPQYEGTAEPARRLGVKALFEAWAKAVQPATSTFDRWSAVFNAADEHFSDAVNIEFADAKVVDERSDHRETFSKNGRHGMEDRPQDCVRLGHLREIGPRAIRSVMSASACPAKMSNEKRKHSARMKPRLSLPRP